MREDRDASTPRGPRSSTPEFIVCTKEQFQDFEREHLIWAIPIEHSEGFQDIWFDGKILMWIDGIDD